MFTEQNDNFTCLTNESNALYANWFVELLNAYILLRNCWFHKNIGLGIALECSKQWLFTGLCYLRVTGKQSKQSLLSGITACIRSVLRAIHTRLDRTNEKPNSDVSLLVPTDASAVFTAFKPGNADLWRIQPAISFSTFYVVHSTRVF